MSGGSQYTVVIPAWNAADTIVETLHSVWQQTVPPVEIVVVDDGSTDNTVSAVQSAGIPVKVAAQPNQGCGAATTTGFSLVGTDFVATVDADDLWLPDKIERQFALLRAMPDVHFVFGHMQAFAGSPDNRIRPLAAGWSRTTMLAQTDVVRSVGPIIDPPGQAGDMIDWLGRARMAGVRMHMLPDLVALRRQRHDSLSNRSNHMRDLGYLEVARQALLRKRMKGGS
jgi:glycosyltransferase involved in cell wall biosynthesis